ncbi:hypothetical protein FHS57_001649 [Runella defluvii]|uniref:Uncharacterized protein n=1 Tax=Runella defluvii TaxID=370973 RepID=A0A7W5ZI12_9BACT|nr:hypothetical protein [Runella defluvii]MBB3837652.1 hypothetical protein [Runella defluvii]
MKKSEFQERLVGLFLRLNGYFQTGYMPHSEIWGQNGTDFDRIGIRFPNHSQSERGDLFSQQLAIPDNTIDIVIAEVKNHEKKFNASIRSIGSRSTENLSQLLHWCGLFEEQELLDLIPQIKAVLDKNGRAANNTFDIVCHENRFGAITIRPILFSIESEHGGRGNYMFINGVDMIQFIWDCLCPDERRADCSTRYPVSNWGFEYKDIVEYFKKRHQNEEPLPSTTDLYNSFIAH